MTVRLAESCSLRLRVNGELVERSVEPRRLLADLLREDLELRGTHLGCEHGVCGACTILLNGEPARSCLLFAVQCEGAEITTVEGLAANGRLSVLQEAFREHHALQCGFCTPGFLMTATYVLAQFSGVPDERQVREALAGNLCRCTGYHNIVDAVRAAAERLHGTPTRKEA
ncbi:MAG TPA: (2Fe-2S)-binding protein [Gaiellaceae bacterium]|nr:(2Fe-2S)-binding protein [Gaiellaceae bacterium]